MAENAAKNGPIDIAALRAVAEAATPGTWHWAGNTDTGEPYLAARGPRMQTSVLAIGQEDRPTTGRAADDVRSYAEESGIDPDEAVDDWALDRYDQPIKEPRLWFYRDHMAVSAREHVRYEVAPEATTRDDPKVYRADITDVRLPDAQHIATFSPATVLALLDLVAQARTWIANCVDPAAVGGDVKQHMLDTLSGASRGSPCTAGSTRRPRRRRARWCRRRGGRATTTGRADDGPDPAGQRRGHQPSPPGDTEKNAPDVAVFVMDRADHGLAAADEEIARQGPG